ncbi:MAG: hypothetical protein A3B70_00515 [Deltaproteobacteria bacterium RIFCSPHIGHO2_02_FULL_40_11]|nr:MAG: hypothetical protein A3B70_00515 [Deltaproteobacteria bacterium RIFCSPHIGHO2_02_FULL_40_11]
MIGDEVERVETPQMGEGADGVTIDHSGIRSPSYHLREKGTVTSGEDKGGPPPGKGKPDDPGKPGDPGKPPDTPGKGPPK